MDRSFPVIMIAAIVFCAVLLPISGQVPTRDSCNGASDGNYPDPASCFTFISCSNGIPHLMDCPENLVFDNPDNKCKYPQDATCPHDCGGRSDGIYTNPGSNCDTFIKCVANRKYVYDCPEDLKFNPSLMVCDYASNFVCTDTPPGPS